MEEMPNDAPPLRLALPKGRMQAAIERLLGDAGIDVRATARAYRPAVSLPRCETKLLKPQNIIEMLHAGSRDAGFAGADLVAEKAAELVELLDTGLDAVRVVAAAPEALLTAGHLPSRRLVVASEYTRLTRRWIECRGLDATLVRSYGATEVFPPEDADVVVDNTATGATLAANGLVVIDELLRSSTRLYANPRALERPQLRARLDDLVLLLRSVLDARRRVMVEVNVSAARLGAVVEILPGMREPTISPLFGDAGFAIKAAIPRDRLAAVLPEVRARGGTDIVVTAIGQIVAGPLDTDGGRR